MLRTSRRPQDMIPTSSMADVAFLLLVFFLVTTVFPKDKGLALVMPQGETEVDESNVLHLLVETEQVVSVRFGANPQARLVAAGEVDEVWRAAVASRPGLIAAVKTADHVSYGAMIAVLDALQSAGATRISLQALRE